MQELINFIIAVSAQVVGNLLCKWLDSKKKDDNQHTKKTSVGARLFWVSPCFLINFMVDINIPTFKKNSITSPIRKSNSFLKTTPKHRPPISNEVRDLMFFYIKGLVSTSSISTYFHTKKTSPPLVLFLVIPCVNSRFHC